MRGRRLVIVAAAAAAALLGSQAVPARGADAAVKLQGSSFRFCDAASVQCSPADGELTTKIKAGTKVTWVYNDLACDVVVACPGHNVVFDGEQATSVKKRDTGSSAQPVIRERTFDKPGTYKYWCSPHKGNGMLGAVVVG